MESAQTAQNSKLERVASCCHGQQKLCFCPDDLFGIYPPCWSVLEQVAVSNSSGALQLTLCSGLSVGGVEKEIHLRASTQHHIIIIIKLFVCISLSKVSEDIRQHNATLNRPGTHVLLGRCYSPWREVASLTWKMQRLRQLKYFYLLVDDYGCHQLVGTTSYHIWTKGEELLIRSD